MRMRGVQDISLINFVSDKEENSNKKMSRSEAETEIFTPIQTNILDELENKEEENEEREKKEEDDAEEERKKDNNDEDEEDEENEDTRSAFEQLRGELLKEEIKVFCHYETSPSYSSKVTKYKQKETFCVKKIPRKIIIIYVNFSNHLIFNISSSISSSDSSNSINKSISTSKSISISKSSSSSSSNINKSISISISKSSSSIIS